MKYLIIVFCLLFASPSYSDSFDEPVKIANHKFPKGSVEEFAATVLKSARKKDFASLKPYFDWTWIESYKSWEPDYPWQTVERAISDADIYIASVEKSKLYKTMFKVDYFSLTANNSKNYATLLIVKDDRGYKLVVQSNGSSIGDLYITLGDSRKHVINNFDKASCKKVSEVNNVHYFESSRGATFRATFHSEESTLEKLEQKIGDVWFDIYLVVFDAEKNVTVKFKTL